MSTGISYLLVGKENKPPKTGFYQVLCVVLKDFYQLEPKNKAMRMFWGAEELLNLNYQQFWQSCFIAFFEIWLVLVE